MSSVNQDADRSLDPVVLGQGVDPDQILPPGNLQRYFAAGKRAIKDFIDLQPEAWKLRFQRGSGDNVQMLPGQFAEQNDQAVAVDDKYGSARGISQGL